MVVTKNAGVGGASLEVVVDERLNHSGVELHGFLSYLVRCNLEGREYHVYGYKGKQVRDNIHSYDLVNAFWHYFRTPKAGGVYNLGGSRHSNCSVLEAAALVEEMTGRPLKYTLSDQARTLRSSAGDGLLAPDSRRRFLSAAI